MISGNFQKSLIKRAQNSFSEHSIRSPLIYPSRNEIFLNTELAAGDFGAAFKKAL